MHKSRFLLVTVFVCLTGACARTSPYVDEAGNLILDPQLVAKSGEATLCVYRPFRFGSGLASPLVLIDGKPAVLLHNAGYTRLFLTPGTHRIEAAHSNQWVKGDSSPIRLEVREGQTDYVQVLPETRTRFFVIGYATDFLLAVVSEDVASGELKELQYLKPE
jgi:hypothetical protein